MFAKSPEELLTDVSAKFNLIQLAQHIQTAPLCIPQKGGQQPESAGVAAQDTWPAACESAVPRMQGGIRNGHGGSREASRAAVG